MNSLDPSRGFTLKAEPIVTTSNLSDSSAMALPLQCGGRGTPSFIMVSCAMFTKVCAAHKLFETFVFSPLSAHCLMPYVHRM